MSISANKVVAGSDGKTLIEPYHDPNGCLKSANTAPKMTLSCALRAARVMVSTAMEKILCEKERKA